MGVASYPVQIAINPTQMNTLEVARWDNAIKVSTFEIWCSFI